MYDTTPKEHAYALGVDDLLMPDISVWTAWNTEGDLMGCAALKKLSLTWGEVKSMRTHFNHLRQGVAAKLLEHIIEQSRNRGYTKLSLETGTGEEFAPAVHLYQKYGFKKGRAFAHYGESPYNQFFHFIL